VHNLKKLEFNWASNLASNPLQSFNCKRQAQQNKQHICSNKLSFNWNFRFVDPVDTTACLSLYWSVGGEFASFHPIVYSFYGSFINIERWWHNCIPTFPIPPQPNNPQKRHKLDLIIPVQCFLQHSLQQGEYVAPQSSFAPNLFNSQGSRKTVPLNLKLYLTAYIRRFTVNTSPIQIITVWQYPWQCSPEGNVPWQCSPDSQLTPLPFTLLFNFCARASHQGLFLAAPRFG